MFSLRTKNLLNKNPHICELADEGPRRWGIRRKVPGWNFRYQYFDAFAFDVWNENGWRWMPHPDLAHHFSCWPTMQEIIYQLEMNELV